VPDQIFVVPSIPKTLNGKKMEVPVKKLLMGTAAEQAFNIGAMENPDAVAYLAAHVKPQIWLKNKHTLHRA
jgi:acetoacetyl-CoA synthetase